MNYDSKLVNYVVERVQDWETGMSQFFGQWNEWVGHYEMRFQDKEPRPQGISKNVVAETPRAVNTLAETITTMQTASDPPFELRAKRGLGEVPEQKLYEMEQTLSDILVNVQFKRYLLKGNRGMCLFGTQVWEKPLISLPTGSPTPYFEGTAFRPLSLLQVAYNTEVYDMEFSDFLAPVVKLSKYTLLDMANSGDGIWDQEQINKSIEEEKSGTGDTGQSKSSIDQRRQRAGYNELKSKTHELILFSGRLSKECLESQEFQEMWAKYGRTDDPRFCDITVGILNRKYLVRFHPTPYGTWRHLYDIGHYIEFELEPMGYGVGALGGSLQKDINKILRYSCDVGKFDLFSMMLAGRGSGLKSGNMNVFPFSAIPVDDPTQIVPLKPNVEGINYGLNLMKQMIEDFRGVTQASSTLQAVLTGATATESTLAQSSSMRSLSLNSAVNGDSVIRPYYRSVIRNLIDQNPFDSRYVDVEVVPKLTTDKDYRPEYSKKLLEFLNLATTIRNVMPIDFNAMPILEYFARSVGINPRELNKPKSQIDRVLEVMRRLNQNGSGKEALATQGEAAGAGVPDGNVSDVPNDVPNSPLEVL